MLPLGHQDEVRKIIGRTDGFGGKDGHLRLGEELTAKICDRFRWLRFDASEAVLHRGIQLEVQFLGRWLEGWSRADLYDLLEVPPWTPDQVRAWSLSDLMRSGLTSEPSQRRSAS